MWFVVRDDPSAGRMLRRMLGLHSPAVDESTTEADTPTRDIPATAGSTTPRARDPPGHHPRRDAGDHPAVGLAGHHRPGRLELPEPAARADAPHLRRPGPAAERDGRLGVRAARARADRTALDLPRRRHRRHRPARRGQLDQARAAQRPAGPQRHRVPRPAELPVRHGLEVQARRWASLGLVAVVLLAWGFGWLVGQAAPDPVQRPVAARPDRPAGDPRAWSRCSASACSTSPTTSTSTTTPGGPPSTPPACAGVRGTSG